MAAAAASAAVRVDRRVVAGPVVALAAGQVMAELAVAVEVPQYGSFIRVVPRMYCENPSVELLAALAADVPTVIDVVTDPAAFPPLTMFDRLGQPVRPA